jgi:putative ABC transport system permease protein
MLQNYLKSAIRNIKRQKGYSLITLFGLTIGITCFILISLYVRYELSYDRFHKKVKNIYRVLVDTGNTYMGKSQVTVTPGPLASAMLDEFPEVLSATKVTARRIVLQHEGNRFAENRVYYADPSFLEIFNFPLLAGNPDKALADPNSLLLSKNMAEKYFGQENPVGKTLIAGKKKYQITGVLENIPGNSHFHFDFLASFSSLVELRGRERVYRWNSWSYHTYVLLEEHADPISLENKLPAFLAKNYKEDARQTLRLQPVEDVHLYTRANFELEPGTDIHNVYLLSAIGLFVLLIACFNYMNLSTARATTRAKEIGMRKVIGARRAQLMRQFLGESVLFSLIALFISVLLVRLLLPAFRTFIDRKLEASFLLDGTLIFTLIGLVLFIGFVSGSYPSLVLSSFQPTAVLKGTRARSSKSSSIFRNSLVICQFAISVALIFCTIVVYNQLLYMKNKDLGFIKDHVVIVPYQEKGITALKNQFLQNAQILDVCSSDELPHSISSASYGEWDGYDPEDELVVYRNWVDTRFLGFYDIPIIQGRGFSEEYNDEEGHAYILNEAAVNVIGWKDPIGKRFGFSEEEMGVVIGVVKDFHFAPLHIDIGPLALTPHSEKTEWLCIKINPHNIPDTLASIERTWKEHSLEREFSYTFLDDRLDRMYRTEKKLGKTFSIYTTIALFIACLGLFGLAVFSAERRTKEIGIRKVLGASGPQIFILLSKEFVRWVLLANIIAWPIAYFAMNKWLQSFAYRTQIGTVAFLLSSGAALLIAWFTVSFQSIRSACTNPAVSLRYE